VAGERLAKIVELPFVSERELSQLAAAAPDLTVWCFLAAHMTGHALRIGDNPRSGGWRVVKR